MSSTTAGDYPESVSSCHPPTPPPSPPPHRAPALAIHGAPLSRRFDFADAFSGGDPEEEEDDDDDFFIRAVESIEKGYNEAKWRAPSCVCGRGDCSVERDEQCGRWMYVCPSQPHGGETCYCDRRGGFEDAREFGGAECLIAGSVSWVQKLLEGFCSGSGSPHEWNVLVPDFQKCNHVSVCEEVGLDPELHPAVRSHPKSSNNCVINISSNHVAEPRTSINNVDLRGAGATTPNIVSPEATIPKTSLNSTIRSAGTSTPLHVSPKGPSATAVVKISPQGAGSNDKWRICKCNAGKCIVLTKGSEDYYVCPIPKGQGACSYMAPVVAVVNEPTQTETMGDKDLKDNLVEKEDIGSNLDQAQDNNANGSVNLSQPDEKEVHGKNLVQAQDNYANGSVNSQSDDEWPFDVVDNEIVLTAQTAASAEVRQASPSMKCESTAMGEAPTESPVPPYDTSSPINPCSENRVSRTGRILEACGELMISCCSGLCPR